MASKITPLKSDDIKLPKAEFIQGEIDFPEMIQKDFRKALAIVISSIITTIFVTAGIWALYYFVL